MTEQFRFPPYAEVDAALGRNGSLNRAAEVHGMLCGLLSADPALSANACLARLADEIADPPGAVDAELGHLLRQLHAATRAQLEDSGFALELHLPDDEQSLATRTEALGQWCQGYGYGLGRGAGAVVSGLPEEAREYLEDLREIARADFDADTAEEADEVAFAEVVEYVRAGALLVFAALRVAQPQGPSNALH